MSKKGEKALTKLEHGQLLVAAEWFQKNYKGYNCVRVCVHPKNKATKAAIAGASHALTYEKLAIIVSDARVLLSTLCESQLSMENLMPECKKFLAKSSLKSERFVKDYLLPFEEIE